MSGIREKGGVQGMLDPRNKDKRETNLSKVGAENGVTLSNVKPAVGFTLPSAGVTPAPGTRKRCGTSSLLEGVRKKNDRAGLDKT